MRLVVFAPIASWPADKTGGPQEALQAGEISFQRVAAINDSFSVK
jgi:hypothetical protein